ncbi:DUF1592 domain-containing protein [Fuerstiella marisgermanici]|uniref:Cytochrome c n=1 Tax=Fuerstiella marisgermanici TaxID=1891926 RepID=A0A1P8WJB0_9PLAN|nr:DUF1592 domain-containing protein [Fuerstiella marisgermanici]APZ94143.1 Cytochrome c [Fuerstiella marisgermanici]
MRVPFCKILGILLLLAPPFCTQVVSDDATQQRGAKVFADQCASCHGAKGEGTSDTYPEALFGDQPTIDLAEYIDKAMPEGEPELCTGDDAKAVAEWMQQAFYSPEAQARINPPRRKLSRLTVSQYRNAIADLGESFAWFNQPDDKQGLAARYYTSRHFRHKDKAFERIDPVIDFQFGEATPDKEKIPKNEEFSIHWEGSLLVDETGWYDFVVKTENGARLYVNGKDTPLIDAWVKSGYDTEYRGSRFLLAGRLYPLKLEWFTFKEKTASVGLWWKPPHGVDQPIPARHLSPQTTPEVVVVEASFPPDDRSDGYIRGTSVSQEWDEATTFAAIEAVDRFFTLLPSMAKLKKDDSDEDRTKKLREFCETFAYRAFRRPVSDAEKQTYVAAQFESAKHTDDAVRRSLLAILKSPRFLYREVTGEQDLFTQASRLSFALMDSIPDSNLLQAASKGWIKDDKGLRDQAWRLLSSYRGKVRLQEFLRVWMNLERLEEVGKDSELYPDFTPELVSDMRTSLELLLEEAADSDDGFRILLTTKDTWMNERMAEFYKAPKPPEDGFQKVAFEPNHRSGITSHPFMLSGLAYHNASSPIHRGVFLSRGILGRALKPPPDSVAPVPPDLEPDLTTRERTSRQTSPTMCFNCHKMINALGFPLEQFDAVGRFREEEKGKPIDASGGYRPRSGESVEFVGATELAEFLVKSHETHRSFARQLFHHMVQQPILAYGPDTIDQLANYFAEHEFDMKKLMVEIAVRSAGYSQPPTNSGATDG